MVVASQHLAVGANRQPQNRAVGNGTHFCDTTRRASQRLTLQINGEIPLHHRSGDNPLDPTTLESGNMDQNLRLFCVVLLV